jgi:hypothetical protein
MTGTGPPDLTRARQDVLALIAGSALGRHPHLEAAAPLRSLPPQLEAKLAAGPASPADLGRRVVGPSAGLAVLDAVAVAVAIGTGHVVLAIVAAVLFVPLAVLAVLGTRYGNSLTVADRTRVMAASRWRSRQKWDGPVGLGRERGLVIAAVAAAARIAASPGWRSGRLDEQRVRLDLATELDQIDDQAHRIAVARVAGAGDPAAEETAWAAVLDRVAALTAYADELDGSAQRQRAAAAAAGGDPVHDGELLAGATLDGFALEHLLALTTFLGAQQQGEP